MSSRSHQSYQSYFHEAFGSGVTSVSFQPPLLGCVPRSFQLASAWKFVFSLCRVQDWASCGERLPPPRKRQSLKGAEEKLFLCKMWKETAETGVTNVSTA